MSLNTSRKLHCFLLLSAINCCATAGNADSKPPSAPEWFTEHVAFLTEGAGCWITSNADYTSDSEPLDHYGNEYRLSIGGSLTGRLYGLEQQQPTEDFWEFRTYWDGNRGEVVILQFSAAGVVGDGTMQQTADGEYLQEQIFSLPDGRTWKTRHVIIEQGQQLITTSLDWENDQWVQQRSYTWSHCKGQ